MKITEVKAIPLRIPHRYPFSVSSSIPAASFDHVLVNIYTSEGIVGHGEAWRLTPAAVCTFIEEALKPLLIGQDPMQVERLWQRMYQTTFRYGQKGIALHCISGVELALWDIIGKSRRLPVYEMLGGACHERLKAYASLPRYQTAEQAVEVAVKCVEKGYRAVKLHQRDIESVSLVRREVGDDIRLMVDVNGLWTPREAVEKIKELAALGVFWIEEPVKPMDDYESLAYVRSRSNILVAAGENEYTHYGFRKMIEKQAVDLLQPDVTKSGGLSVCRKILAMAEAWNLLLIPHCYYFGPGVAATLHFAVGNMLSDYVEIHAVDLEASYIQPSLRPVDGFLKVPDRPGLGIEIDEDVVKKYPYS